MIATICKYIAINYPWLAISFLCGMYFTFKLGEADKAIDRILKKQAAIKEDSNHD